MTDIEIGVLTLLAKAVFVLVTAACMVQFAQRIQLTRRRGWQVLVPLLESTVGTGIDEAKAAGAKSRLQEQVQSRGLELPQYRHVSEEGPDHEKLFHVECWVDGELLSRGRGSTKKQAEQRAARQALDALSESTK